MRKNLARNAISDEPGSSVDLWNTIHYLDRDLQCKPSEDRKSDGIAILIALLIGLLLASGLCLYVRTL